MHTAVACLGRGLRGYESEQDLYARVKTAVHLFKTKKVDYIIMSGGYTTSAKFSEASIMKQIACDMGVPPECILLEEKSTNTVENAMYIHETADANSITSLLVVTSPYHLLRTRIIFNKVIADKEMRFFPSSYPYKFSMLLMHYLSESVRLARILFFGISLPKKKPK